MKVPIKYIRCSLYCTRIAFALCSYVVYCGCSSSQTDSKQDNDTVTINSTTNNVVYQRKTNCDLDQLNINGNVVKIETIVKSTIPFTEMAYDTYGKYGINATNGNVVLDFDNYGFIKKYSGFDIKGKSLFEEIYNNEATDFTPAVAGAVQTIKCLNSQKNENGQLVYAEYVCNENVRLKMNMFFNEHGDLSKITKVYDGLDICDSTLYDYTKFDNHDNWIESEVSYYGYLKKHNHKYSVKRQISYDGEQTKLPLIFQLAAYNIDTTVCNCNMKKIDGEFGEIFIPDYMKCTDNIIQYPSYVSSYSFINSNDDAYSYFSLVYDTKSTAFFAEWEKKDFEYNSTIDEKIRQLYEQNQNVKIFKWFPYRFTKICGHYALQIQYYRYGNGSPIPVYVEQYVIDNPKGKVEITFSYQSDKQSCFQKTFNKSLTSLKLF
ncbi:MAG: hypothetical protein J5588_00975 [Bacteroidales bacterium]|nr:hypothetical protein [Bacteroidales bacterium]